MKLIIFTYFFLSSIYMHGEQKIIEKEDVQEKCCQKYPDTSEFI